MKINSKKGITSRNTSILNCYQPFNLPMILPGQNTQVVQYRFANYPCEGNHLFGHAHIRCEANLAMNPHILFFLAVPYLEQLQ